MPDALSLEQFCKRYGFPFDPTGVVDMAAALAAYNSYLMNPQRYGFPSPDNSD